MIQVEQQVGNPIPSFSNDFLCICQPRKHGEETVTCANVNCIVKVFHKCCVVPKRVRWNNWHCKTCALEKRKALKQPKVKLTSKKDKENLASKKVNSKTRLPNLATPKFLKVRN